MRAGVEERRGAESTSVGIAHAGPMPAWLEIGGVSPVETRAALAKLRVDAERGRRTGDGRLVPRLGQRLHISLESHENAPP